MDSKRWLIVALGVQTYHNRVGDIRVGRVRFVSVNCVDAPEDGQANGRELFAAQFNWGVFSKLVEQFGLKVAQIFGCATYLVHLQMIGNILELGRVVVDVWSLVSFGEDCWSASWLAKSIRVSICGVRSKRLFQKRALWLMCRNWSRLQLVGIKEGFEAKHLPWI